MRCPALSCIHFDLSLQERDGSKILAHHSEDRKQGDREESFGPLANSHRFEHSLSDMPAQDQLSSETRVRSSVTCRCLEQLGKSKL